MEKIPGTIILVDDHTYEADLLQIGIDKAGLEVNLKYFNSGEAAIDFLKQTKDKIFLIISDMNMPTMNGLQMKKLIDNDPEIKDKAIPFIFQSSSTTEQELIEAYNYRLQGYFTKPSDIDTLVKQLEVIISYWRISRHPNDFHT